MLIICSLLLCLGKDGYIVESHPCKDIIDLYADRIDYEYLAEPYILSMLAINEVKHERNYEKVKAFIKWYFSKLNKEDIYGMSGTIYVYTLDNGKEKSTHEYDSVDGYSGMFLQLLHQYVVKTHDINLIKKNWSKIEDVAYTIPYLQCEDGLTIAYKSYEVKYLMDNCEAYGGINAYLELRKIIGLKPSLYYKQVANSIKKGIMKKLYDHSAHNFGWEYSDDQVSKADWNVFYPDAYAQIFPIYYGIIEDNELKKELWQKFRYFYPPEYDTYPIEQQIVCEWVEAIMTEK